MQIIEKNYRTEIVAVAGWFPVGWMRWEALMRVQHLQGAQGKHLLRSSHTMFLPEGRKWKSSLHRSGHKTGSTISPLFTKAVPENRHRLHCCVKEWEKFTSEDKMVLLFIQSRSLCNSTLNGKVQLEPGTCCLQKYYVIGSNVKCSKWCRRQAA